MPSRMNVLSNRRVLGRVVAIAAALVLLIPVGASQAQPDQSTVPGKKFAAYEYGWYPIRHVDHFDNKMPRYWQRSGAGKIRTQHGMFTMMSRRHGSVAATMKRHVWDRGRWEIRMRAKRLESGNADFVAQAELIPAGNRAYNCGARNIAFASTRLHSKRATHYIRTLPNREFSRTRSHLRLSTDEWHTYGVEVTPRRISWFMDGKVRSTEKRRIALHGVPMVLRLRLLAAPGQTMNKSRLQVDTVRYFTLKSPNKKSVRAPRPTQGTHGGAC